MADTQSPSGKDHPQVETRDHALTRADWVYFIAFTALCVAFVPVYFYFGFNDITVPLSAILFDSGRRFLVAGTSGTMLFGWICVSLYAIAFMIAGSVIIRLTTRIEHLGRRLLIRRVILLLVFLISFAPLITYSSVGRQGGNYNFWSATARYFQQLG